MKPRSEMLLKGTCTLIFEGQSFVPDDDVDRKYWLEINEDIRKQLIDRLSPSGWHCDFDAFHAEFWGTLYWEGWGHGHLGVFGGTAGIDELVSVQFTKREQVGSPFRGIHGRLRGSRAQKFAVKAHGDQRYGDKPHVEHLSAVVRILRDFDASLSCMVAAWLHDVVEDTATTLEQVRSEFGEEVANLVWAVTGEGNGDRHAHSDSIYKKVAAHPDAALVKLADRIANIEACEAGDKHFLRYSSEHAEFEKAIKPHVSQPMWQRYLDGLKAKAA